MTEPTTLAIKVISGAVVTVASSAVLAVFTASDWIAILGAVGVLVAAIAAAVIKIISALNENAKDTANKLGMVEKQATAIEGLVNSKSSRMEAEIASLRRELEGKTILIAKQDQAAALLAQAVVVAAPAISPAVPAVAEVKVVNPVSDPANIKQVK